jgi:tRNA(Ile)-lysidine synthase TilS/MesJ
MTPGRLHNRNYGKWFASDVLRAIRRYAMIEPGGRVAVALSGGKDSATLLFILNYLRSHSHLRFDLSAVHIRTAEYDTGVLRQLCDGLAVPYLEDDLRRKATTSRTSVCYTCARLKRGAIRALLQRHGIGTVAYGHHATDAAETFFMNLIENRRLGSFSPKVDIGEGVVIVRPMIYLEESTVSRIHKHAGLPLLDFICPHAEHNVRREYKTRLAEMERLLEANGLARTVVEALERDESAGDDLNPAQDIR